MTWLGIKNHDNKIDKYMWATHTYKTWWANEMFITMYLHIMHASDIVEANASWLAEKSKLIWSDFVFMRRLSIICRKQAILFVHHITHQQAIDYTVLVSNLSTLLEHAHSGT